MFDDLIVPKKRREPNQIIIKAGSAYIACWGSADGHNRNAPHSERVIKGFGIIDISDVASVGQYRWFIDSVGYLSCNKLHIRLHQFLLGRQGKGLHIDHINHNKRDNRRSNIRVITHSQNVTLTKRTDRGVYFSNTQNRWVASIHINKKKIHLGTFRSRKEASDARKQGENRLLGELSRFKKKDLPDERSIGI